MIYKIVPPLSLNDTGANVTNLKAALQEILNKFQNQLGINASDQLWIDFSKELAQTEFTPITEKIVELFQSKMMGAAETGKVDDATAAAINKLLNLKDEMPAEEMFIVQGNVKSSEGFLVDAVHVRAYDIDLRAEEFLGEMKTSSDGAYQISYGRNAFTRAEKNSADLLMRVLDGQGVELYQSNILFNAPPKAIIDLLLPKEVYKGTPEFVRYQNELQPVLAGVEIKDLDEKDINFLTNETGINAQHLTFLVKAFTYGDKQNRMPEIYYGLLRQNLPTALKDLLSVKQQQWRDALLKSIDQNIISDDLKSQMEFTLGILLAYASQLLSQTPADTAYKGPLAFLPYVNISDALKQKYATLYLQNDNTSFEQAIAKDAELSTQGVQDELKFVLAANTIVRGDLNLLAILNEKKDVLLLSKEKDIARLKIEDWKNLVQSSGISDPGEIQTKATKYLNTTEKIYPTATIYFRLSDSSLAVNPFGGSKDEIVHFLEMNTEFDIRTATFNGSTGKENQYNWEGISDPSSVKNNLKTMQRLQKTKASFDGMMMMVQDGITSSLQIAQQSKPAFVVAYGPTLGGDIIATQVYNNATLNYQLSYLLGIELIPQMHIPLNGIYGSGPELPAATTSPDTWEAVFGPLDSCDCEHCMSVYSPAAYLTDLLHFLFEKSPSAFKILTQSRLDPTTDPRQDRRPDLRHILLNCTNTNTPLPYIDLVNEILSSQISRTLSTDNYQTTWTAEELSANPENFNAANIDRLKNEVYPFSLPYNDALESSRIYLKQLGVELHEVLEVFNAGEWTENNIVAVEYLGLSPLDAAIITSTDREELPDIGQLYHYYGYETGVDWIASLTHADIFLNKTSLSYIQLLQLLECNFINPVTGTDEHGHLLRTVNIRSVDETDPYTCNISKLELNGLDENWLRKIYRFIRLSRKTGWSFRELDQCLTFISTSTSTPGIITDDTLLQLSFIKRIHEKFKIELSELLMLWSEFDLHIYNDFMTDGQPSIQTLFEKLFLNKSVINPIDTAFAPPPSVINGVLSVSVTPGETLQVHKNTIIAALQITESNLMLLLSQDEETSPHYLIEIEDSNLTVHNLAVLYRYTLLSRLLKISISDLLEIKKLVNWFNSPSQTWKFIGDVEFINNSKFSIEEIKYLLNSEPTVANLIDPTNNEVKAVLKSLADGLKKISRPDVSSILSTFAFKKDSLKQRLNSTDIITEIGNMTFENLDLDSVADTVKNYVLETPTTITLDISIPEELSDSESLNGFLTAVVEQFRGWVDKLIQSLIEALKEKLKTSAEIIESLILELMVDSFNNPKDDFLELLTIDFTTNPPALRQVNIYKRLYKACFVINRLKLQLNEIKFIHTNTTSSTLDVARLNITTIFTYENFHRLVQLIQLRDSLPYGEISLFDILQLTNSFDSTQITNAADASIAKAKFVSALKDLTGWNEIDLNLLTDDWSDATLISYQNGLAIIRLKQQFDFLKRMGATTEFCLQFINTSEISNGNATAAKNLVKSKYDNKTWLTIAKPLSDQLRIKRRDAMVAYLLYNRGAEMTYGEDRRPCENPNDLFNYLLIDVEMDACMITSRIKQAISSVQLFMDRVLMNLEPGVVYHDEIGTPPEQIAKDFADQWKKWRKVYRIWEANRKIFLYPENWIEPELRDNKSPLFKELENQLLQNEITDVAAEDALRDYLEKLDAVARLEIVGMYHQVEASEGMDILHVFGRTYAEPHIYYYRKLEDKEWSAWEKVDLNIEGDHLIPVVWNRRLYLFWPIFTEKAVQIEEGDPSLNIPPAGSTASPPKKYWEIKLAWSEYKGKKWLAKKIIDDKFLTTYSTPILYQNFDTHQGKENFYFSVNINEDDQIEFNGYCTWVEHILNIGCIILNSRIIGLKVTPFQPVDSSFLSNLNYFNLYRYNMYFAEYINSSSFSFRLPYPSDQLTSIFPILRNTRSQFKLLVYPAKNLNLYDSLFFMDEFNTFYLSYNFKFIFQTYYYPQMDILIDNLNKVGLKGLYDANMQRNHNGTNLLDLFNYEPTVNVSNIYPTDKLDYTTEYSYSIYNWELFFHIPFLIATQLNKNQKFDEARKWFHYIFNPTVPSTTSEGVERFWITKPFYELVRDHGILTLEQLMESRSDDLYSQIQKWEKNPFQPHIIARMRIVAYMKTVMMKYIDNLIAWGDQLYRQDTIETINEATQLYVLAAQLLGKRPEKIPSRIDKTVDPDLDYDDLSNLGLDAFSNALIEIEGYVPSHDSPTGGGSGTDIIRPFYFCFIPNEKLLGYWDIVADRLFKIRHCMNIEGMVQQLPLFEPPIDPALLVRAQALGIDLSTMLDGSLLSLPNYRFNVMLQKANELCNDVKSLGAALLSAWEKRDAEELSRLRSTHELNMLGAIKDIKEKQVEEATENLNALNLSRLVIEERINYYTNLSFTNTWENTALTLMTTAMTLETTANVMEIAAGVAHLIPSISVGVSGWGGTPSFKSKFGGKNIGKATEAHASAFHSIASNLNMAASLSSTLGGFWRRKDEWDFQARVAQKELDQIEVQIAAAEIRVAIAEKDLDNHNQQIENTGQVNDYMRSKFSNQELYEWMIGQISATYFQSYQLAFDIARKAEKCFQHELGVEGTSYIQFGYWDSLKKGLLSGEKLQYDLRRLENAYIEQNKREFEITKHLSLTLIDPLALLQLKETGACDIKLPEELFDLDFPGHYFRRIKSMSISIPCIAGPYTSVNATLRLSKNEYRIDNSAIDAASYKKTTSEISIPGSGKFRSGSNSISAIATSNAQNDSGVFELNFRDERYLPFEGTGVASSWSLELMKETSLRQFNYETISDVILHLKYTARESSNPLFKQAAVDNLKAVIIDAASSGMSLSAMFDVRHEFPDEWHRFLTVEDVDGKHTLSITVSSDQFPFFTKGKRVQLASGGLFIKLQDSSAVSIRLLAPAIPPENKLIKDPTTFPLLNIYSGELTLNTELGEGFTFTVQPEDFNAVKDILEMVLIVTYALVLA